MRTVMWDELTAHELRAAAKACRGVCILPIGCLEKHAEHLPIGTDVIIGGALGKAAAEVEPAVVFPSHPFGSVMNLRCHAGVVALPSRMLLELWESLCDNIARDEGHKTDNGKLLLR